MLGLVGQVGIAGGGEYGVMAEKLLHLDQVDPGLDQVGRIAVPPAVGRDLFFRPQASVTLCRVVCTPPRSSGVLAVAAPCLPEWRLGNSNTGLRCVCQKRRRSRSVACGSGTKRSLLPLASRICTRARAASISANCSRSPSPRRSPRLYSVKKNTR